MMDRITWHTILDMVTVDTISDHFLEGKELELLTLRREDQEESEGDGIDFNKSK